MTARAERDRAAWRIAVRAAIVFAVLLPLSQISTGPSVAAEGLRLEADDGRTFVLPLGFPAFADELVSRRTGRPAAPAAFRDPSNAIGLSDGGKTGGYYAPACKSEAVYGFTFNGLIDLPGPDLLILGDPGAGVRPDFAVSEDGSHWLQLPQLPIGEAVDLAGLVPPATPFRFIRISGPTIACRQAQHPALIDALATLQVGLRSVIYFDFDSASAEERSADNHALAELRLTLGLIKPEGDVRLSLRIAGHADGYGPARHNMDLSRARAEEVARAARQAGFEKIDVAAYGETRQEVPRARIPERWRNRRVELFGYWEQK